MELIQLGAAELARLIRKRELDPLEVVDSYIAQIERVNPTINALITPTFDQAREEARRAREKLTDKAKEPPPLLGVPFTVKDSLPVAGVRFTAGSIFHRDDVAMHDAEAVRRMRRAGAIVLAKTSCSDMSASAETANLIVGLTRNPWKLDHSAGGSSGGEAALIAAGGSPLGLGADVGGSIRIPAAFCGVVGLKPTGGRIPTDGHIPQVPATLSHWNTVGPLARRVEDIALALSVLSETPVTDYRSVNLMGRRLLIPSFSRSLPVTRDIAVAIKNSASALRDAGMVEERVSLPFTKVVLECTAILYREVLPQSRVDLGGGKPIGFWSEAIAHYRGKPRLSSVCMGPLALFPLFGPMLRMLGYGHHESVNRLRNSIQRSIGLGSVLLWPVFPTTAPKHGFAWKPNKSPHYTIVSNCLGFPAISIPVGVSKQGLPVSVQVIGQPNDDETVLATAAALERAFGGSRVRFP